MAQKSGADSEWAMVRAETERRQKEGLSVDSDGEAMGAADDVDTSLATSVAVSFQEVPRRGDLGQTPGVGAQALRQTDSDYDDNASESSTPKPVRTKKRMSPAGFSRLGNGNGSATSLGEGSNMTRRKSDSGIGSDSPRGRVTAPPSEAGSVWTSRRRQTMAESSITGLIKPLDVNQDGTIQKRMFMKLLAINGLSKDDPRLTKLIADLDELDDIMQIPKLVGIITHSESSSLVTLLIDVLSGHMVIPDFGEFTDVLTEIYDEVKALPITGDVADYIPALADVPADKFAIAVTTRSGQRFSLGDTKDFFCLQSVSKVGTYCEALKLHGTTATHMHVGREPSGEPFNAMTLKAVDIPEHPERTAIPHNPCINAGAIMCTSLNHPELKESRRLAEYLEAWSRLCGSRVGFDPMVMVSERESADTNNALAYMMREAGAFQSKDIDINETLELYFSTCAVTCSADMLATAGATIANSGINPITNVRVYDNRICKNAMSLMLSCGMYDFSGEWAFTVGLPAKSGVSGIIMIVVPNICGICVWSPPLDKLGNSVKGIEFAKRLVERFAFHHLSSTRFSKDKINPTISQSSQGQRVQLNLMYAASSGDLSALRQIAETQPDLGFGTADYDHRTPLHLAATEGHTDVVEFLLEHGADPSAVDRWGSTPLDDAILNGFANIQELLESVGAVRGTPSTTQSAEATPVPP